MNTIDRYLAIDEENTRLALELASDFVADDEEGRWVIMSKFRRREWRIIVEPEASSETLVVVTAYSLGKT